MIIKKTFETLGKDDKNYLLEESARSVMNILFSKKYKDYPKFEEYTLKEIRELCFKEIQNELDYLMSFEPYDWSLNSEGIPTLQYDRNSDTIYMTFANSEDHYSIEGLEPDKILGIHFERPDDFESFHRTLFGILCEYWYFWEGKTVINS